MLKLRFLSSLLIFLLLNSEKIFSQNLITNGSFEILSSCPDNASQLPKAIGWISPTLGSPDLYNSCSLIGAMNVPENILGYQNSEEGNGYTGIYIYSIQDTNFTINMREYIQSQLISNLNSCSIYKLYFYVSLADSSHYAINSIGAHLSTNAISRIDYYCFSDYKPQINNLKSRILSDKLGWTKIEGKFVAEGGEQYITIGNFDLDSEIDTLATNNNLNLSYAYSYYYIDSVSLTLFADASMPSNAGPDINLTEGDSVFIGQEISNLNCTWSILGGSEIADSVSGIYVQPTATTTYLVEQNLCGVTTYDTVTVFVHGVGLEETSPFGGGLRGRIVIIPNPNNGSFEIDLSQLNNSLQEISILDASSRIVFEDKSVSSKNKLSIQAHLEKGVYFLRVSSEKGVFEEKIIIQ